MTTINLSESYLSHFLLSTTIRPDSSRDMTDNRGDNAEIEREANYFAANILMPEKLVINRVEEIRKNAVGSTPSFLLAKLIADDFYVSESTCI